MFSVERVATINLPRTSRHAALAFALEIDVVNGIISGVVTNTNFVSTLVAVRNPFSSRSNPAPHRGRYNAAFPGTDDPELAPAGDGFAALTLTSSGRVSGRGTLADGSSLKLFSASGANGEAPVYVSLYRGKGSIFGWLTITNTEFNDVSGTLWWTKPTNSAARFYPGGFMQQIETVGSQYTAVPAGTPVLTLANGMVSIFGGNLMDAAFTNSLPSGTNKFFGDNSLTLTIFPAKGLMTGSFVDPISSRKRTVKGIALPKQNQARGFFLGRDESGRVFIGEAP
jgi:hypothetical protein